MCPNKVIKTTYGLGGTSLWSFNAFEVNWKQKPEKEREKPNLKLEKDVTGPTKTHGGSAKAASELAALTRALAYVEEDRSACLGDSTRERALTMGSPMPLPRVGVTLELWSHDLFIAHMSIYGNNHYGVNMELWSHDRVGLRRWRLFSPENKEWVWIV